MGNKPSIDLPHLNAEPDTVTISGGSAGCYMAHRLSIINSDAIKGAGLFFCWAFDTDLVFVDEVTQSPEQLAAIAIESIDEKEKAGRIDPTSNLKDRAYTIWSGRLDEVTPWQG